MMKLECDSKDLEKLVDQAVMLNLFNGSDCELGLVCLIVFF